MSERLPYCITSDFEHDKTTTTTVAPTSTATATTAAANTIAAATVPSHTRTNKRDPCASAVWNSCVG